MRRLLTGLAALTLLLAACGDDGDAGPDTEPGTTAPTSDTSDPGTTAPTSSDPDGSAEPGGELPGERSDLFPYEGAELAVVGVATDDTLNVRTGPGTSFDAAFTLGPLADGVVATGHNRILDDSSLWVEVTADGETGWANGAFLSHPGQTRDATADVVTDPTTPPGAETMLDLGQAVAGQLAPDGGEPALEVTVVDGPTVGDLGEITLDVLGLGDDAALGWRVHVFADPAPGGEAFVLRTVELTVLCRRGTSGDGLCL